MHATGDGYAQTSHMGHRGSSTKTKRTAQITTAHTNTSQELTPKAHGTGDPPAIDAAARGGV